ncbi:hypothetical protein [Liquorilactobacillus mali]|uniref:Uncharacterized protein n=1 Tax=Liquorilactobacillus mali TaxID=1618 RepID=A0A0R2FRJ6_9LACO|nr:hypothetical protein [Liquorilactobacillus mali]KRN31113.1 hypothetical protein IV36_GL001920 [Liquorilactobacillus mali]
MNAAKKARTAYLLAEMGSDLTLLDDDDERLVEYRKLLGINYTKPIKLKRILISKEAFANEIKKYRTAREMMEIFSINNNKLYYLINKFELRDLWNEYVILKDRYIVIQNGVEHVINGGGRGIAEYFRVSIYTARNKIMPDKEYKGAKLIRYRDYIKE